MYPSGFAVCCVNIITCSKRFIKSFLFSDMIFKKISLNVLNVGGSVCLSQPNQLNSILF